MDKDRAEVLESIVTDVNELIGETKDQYRELQITKQRLKNLHNANKIDRLEFIVEKERIAITEESINDCLRRLERQKKIAVFELMKLE